MAKSQRLRWSEVKAIYRLIAECRERGCDAQEWRQSLTAGLRDICRARICTSGEAWGTPTERMKKGMVQLVGTGFDAESAANFEQYKEHQMMMHDPVVVDASCRAAPSGTFGPEHLVGEKRWFSTIAYNDYYRVGRCNYCLFSYHVFPDPSGMNTIALFRSSDMKRFDEHDRRLLDLVQEEIGRLLGGPLALAVEPGLSDLPPRVRQLLEALLEGDSEKQAAHRLGISAQTVHDYVKTLYRHFGVNSRAELMAVFLRRLRGRPGGSDRP